jgi:FtsP/CotA-like multicopper oxidase with cupredoxin domain
MRIQALSAALLFSIAACGGDSADAPASSAPAAPATEASAADASWFSVDEAAQTVSITIAAGSTSANNYWNYNGLYGGSGLITVPEGYTVTITFENKDPNMAHSIGLGERSASYPTNFTNPQPVFAGAMSENPTSMIESTLPGETEVLTFTASAAGEYTLICYVSGHAATGMYLNFNVSTDGSYGVQL